MPIELSTSVTQSDRSNRVSNPIAFYHLIEGADVDLSVEKILESGDTFNTPPKLGDKYILLSFDSISPPNTSLNDIVIWNGNEFVLHQKMTNSKTRFGLVFDKRTKKFYHYVDATTGWVPILRSGSVDGGTFG